MAQVPWFPFGGVAVVSVMRANLGPRPGGCNARFDRRATGSHRRHLQPAFAAIPAHRFGERLAGVERRGPERRRSEEHTSELQSLMRISYAVFCLKKKKDKETRKSKNLLQTKPSPITIIQLSRI